MTLIRPGLGQIYNGQLSKAIFIIVLEYCYIPLLLLVAFNALSAFTIISLVVIAAAFYIFVFTDAILAARKIGADYVPRRFNNVYAYIVIVVVLGTINYFSSDYVKNNVIESFRFPSGSMLPTLQIGDQIFADRSLSARSPKHGDIVVFEYPENPERNFLKRVVAIGGDNVELRNAVLYVNGNVISEPYLKQPENNEKVPPSLSGSDYGPVVVPDNSYFVLGDNRDNSQDSRYFGFVAQDKMKGIARSIYWSWDKSSTSVRWNRIGMPIR